MSTTKNHRIRHNKTKKLSTKSLLSKASLHKPKQGWIQITISGEPYERGFQHGHLLADQFSHIRKVLSFEVKTFFKKNLKDYIRDCTTLITPNIKKHYPEFFEEIRGIAAGAKVPIDFIVAWNSLLSMSNYYRNDKLKDSGARCSAFIACGNATKSGDVVMAHNTHSDYASGPLGNIIMRVIPTTGHSFIMQTYAGYIASGTDWFLCTSGIIGCETTISNINYYPQFGSPYFCRIRDAMQYGTTLEEYSEKLLNHNAGDYACSWLFGDVKRNKIMLCEIGLNKSNIQIATNGVFYGMNSAIGVELRTTETDDNTQNDLMESSGARNVRLDALLNEKYYGKIDIDIAKLVISDHYDTNQNKTVPSSLTICKHSELDPGAPGAKRPFYPWGCVDGKVINSSMAKNMEFLGRNGASCGIPFYAKKYLKSHPEYAKWKHVLRDMPTHRWTKLGF
jgi:hypothetical protein